MHVFFFVKIRRGGGGQEAASRELFRRDWDFVRIKHRLLTDKAVGDTAVYRHNDFWYSDSGATVEFR